MAEISVNPPPANHQPGDIGQPVTPYALADPEPEKNPVAAELYTELRRRPGDRWLEEAGRRAVEVTEEGDVVIHTSKWISFMWGKGESEGLVLALHRAQKPACISLLHEDGEFEMLGPVDLET